MTMATEFFEVGCVRILSVVTEPGVQAACESCRGEACRSPTMSEVFKICPAGQGVQILSPRDRI